jgi:polyhydroxybutyrate depolymerase
VERGQDGDRDLALVDVALASLRKQYRIDDSRIYATGFSNGAMLTYLLWAERPKLFAAFAPVSGRIRPSIQPTERRPLLHVAGTRDATVAFADQKAAFEAAIRVNGASDQSKACGDGCTVYGANTTAPVMVVLHDGGHTYPRGTSERIVAFLREHVRR